VRFDTVPDAAHNGWRVLPAVKDFFASAMSAR
jgi:hypothetical protein